MKADFYPRLTLIIITAATLVLTFLYFYKRYVNHIPGPSRGDALYKLALEKMHLGMIELHEKYGEVVLFPLPAPSSGSVIYLRANSSLDRVFTDNKHFSKNTDTWAGAGNMSDVNNLIQPMYNGSLFEVAGKEHTANRKVVNPFFAHPKILDATIKAFSDLSDRWGESYTGDVLEDFHSIVKFAMVDLLGSYYLTPEDEEILDAVILHFVRKNAGGGDPRLMEEDEKVFVTMEGVAQRVVDHVKAEIVRKEEGADVDLHTKGLVYLMLKSKSYSEKAIKELFVNLVVAGGETPALAACKTLAAIAKDPVVLETAVKEVDSAFTGGDVDPDKVDGLHYLDSCVNEGLRRYAPATIVGRRCIKDTEICGVPIPKDTSVQVSVHAAHMNPAVWDEPEKFDPSRFARGKKVPPGGLVAFGLGGRSCPGKRAYMKMAKVMLACMLQKYVVSEVPGEENDLDSFLPNRFVAWPASNKVTLKLATRFQVQANEKLFERTENRPSDVSRQSSLSARFFINPLS